MEQQCGFARWFQGRGTVGGSISAAFSTFVDFQLVAPGRATLSQTNINRGRTRLRCRSRGPSPRQSVEPKKINRRLVPSCSEGRVRTAGAHQAIKVRSGS